MTETNTPEQSATAAQLTAFFQRIERLLEEKKTLGEDINEIYKEAKGSGYDTGVMKKLISIRAKDPSKVAEEEELLDLYKQALGMI